MKLPDMAAGEEAFAGGQGFDSPTGTNPRGQLQEPQGGPAGTNPMGQLQDFLEQGQGYNSPASTSRMGQLEEPPLHASSSPVARAIPFMTSPHPTSPSHPHEMSLDTWGVGQAGSGGQGVTEGWEEEGNWWEEDSADVHI